MPSVMHHQGNANQSDSDISPHLIRITIIKKKGTMLTKMQKRRTLIYCW